MSEAFRSGPGAADGARVRSGSWLLLVTLATVAGGILRFAAIGEQSFWYDESVGDALATRATYAELFTGRVRDNGLPPLYYLLDKAAVEHLGTDEASHRTLPAVFGTLTIPLIGLLGRRLHSAQAGAVAAWLLAVSPFQLEMANEARVYSVLHFVLTLDAILFLGWLAVRSWPAGLAYAVATAVACYSHYYVVFFILGQLVVLLMQPDRWRLVGRWCVLMSLAALLWLPWAPAFLGQLTTPGNLSRMGGSWKTQFAATPVVFAVGRTFAWRSAGHLMQGTALAVSLAGYWIPALLGMFWPQAQRRVCVPLLSAWVLLTILVPLAAAAAGVPVYHHRYASVALPGFLVALAIGLVQLPRIWQSAAALVIVASTAYSLMNYYTAPIKDDWRSAARAILDNAPPGQVVLTDSDIEVVPFLYYVRRNHAQPPPVYGLMMEQGSSDLMAVKYEDGVKLDRTPRNYTAEILSASCVAVALCVPQREESFYQSLMREHGFRVTKTVHCYRVAIIRFERARGQRTRV